jgi:hypothetical protein
MSTYQTQLLAKLETARQERKLATENAKLSLLNNENFIATKLNSVLKSEELLHLNTLVTQVSAISPFIAKDGTKYGVRVFPIAIFGLGFGQLIGLIKGSDNAFTDEMLAEYSAITGIESVELREASHFLGSVAYCNKAGVVVDAEPCNWSKFQPLLHSIAMSLGFDAFNVAEITQDRIDLWFAKELIKANKQAKEIAEAHALDTATDAFTLED